MRMYVYWSDSPNTDPVGLSQASYWTHDNKKCRLAARLEGYELYRHPHGENPKATCCVCKKRFIEEAV